MTQATQKLIEEALRLPRESRAFLAEKLLESLDECENAPMPSAQWMDEIRRRCREIDAGTVTLIPGERVFEEVDRNLG
jgi:putative addiction module component (TIGR02574 family)